jgi:eukaryotic-like serine/threonine-protein kinase
VKAGDRIANRYEVRELLGRGGFGEVWSALDAAQGEMRAVKFLVGPALERPDGRARFLAEARIANAFVHPNLVQVHDVVRVDETLLALVMELLEGQTLGARLAEREPMPLREVAGIMGPVLAATMAIHERGIVHRDIKPDNIFLAHTRFGIVMPKLLDFGIAKLADQGVTGITSTGTTLGTPCYMAPEQAFGDAKIDARADVFALGVVIYECLSGIRPIEAGNLLQYIKQLKTSAIVPLGELQPDLPREVIDLTMRMLSMDRGDRPSLDAMLGVLTARDSSLGENAISGSSSSPDVAKAAPPTPPEMDETYPAPTRRKLAQKLARTVPEDTVDGARPNEQHGEESGARRWVIGIVGGIILAIAIGAAVVAIDPGSRVLLP